MRWPVFLVCLTLIAACDAVEEGVSSTRSPFASLSSPIDETTTSSSSTTTSTRPTPTTQTSTAPTAPLTATTTSVESLLALRTDGLSNLDFGESTTSAMESLADLLGPPVPGEEYPYGGHPLRFVYWRNVGLAVIFSDYGFYRDDGVEHFVGWTHSPHIEDLAAWDHGPASLTLQTAEGIGIGSSLADLQSAYTDRVVLEAECDPGGPPTSAYIRFVDPDDGRISSIRFGFEGLPLGPTSRIVSLMAGAGPGC